MDERAELIARLDEAFARVATSKARVRGGAGGQTIEATAKATMREISDWDLELLALAAEALRADITIPTEGAEWDAAVERAARALCEVEDEAIGFTPSDFMASARAALRAALTPKGDQP